MKYIIDVEKIEGTNLWKAKGFNALVFDENGLDKMTAIYKDKQQIEINMLNRELDDKDFRVGQLQNLVNGKSRKINKMHSVIKKLEKENKELKEYNIVLKDDLREIDILAKISEGATEQRLYACEKVEELEHKIESQKCMLIKQGKCISKLQKEKKKLNNLLTKEKIKNVNFELENKKLKEHKELKQRCKFEDIDRLRESIDKLVTENENLKIELKKRNEKLEKVWKERGINK